MVKRLFRNSLYGLMILAGASIACGDQQHSKKNTVVVEDPNKPDDKPIIELTQILDLEKPLVRANTDYVVDLDKHFINATNYSVQSASSNEGIDVSLNDSILTISNKSSVGDFFDVYVTASNEQESLESKLSVAIFGKHVSGVECVPVSFNGNPNNKIDIIVAPDGYDGNTIYRDGSVLNLDNLIKFTENFFGSCKERECESAYTFFGTVPFSDYEDRFNVYYLTNSGNTACENSILGCQEHLSGLAETCPYRIQRLPELSYDVLVMMIADGTGTSASTFQLSDKPGFMSIQVNNGYEVYTTETTTIHESGHGVAQLRDNYPPIYDRQDIPSIMTGPDFTEFYYDEIEQIRLVIESRTIPDYD